VQSRLASALVGRVLDEMSAAGPADIARAEGLIGQALAASPLSPLAHFAKGQLLRAKGRCDEAISEYETALASNHNWASALANIGRCKIYVGPIEEAPPLEEQAIRLSPFDPQIGVWHFRIGQAHLVQSRVEEAIVSLEKARSANPTLVFVHRWLASAYALVGDTERAAAEIAEARRLNGSGSSPSAVSLNCPYMHDKVQPSPSMGEGWVGVTPLKSRGSRHANSCRLLRVTNPETKMKYLLILRAGGFLGSNSLSFNVYTAAPSPPPSPPPSRGRALLGNGDPISR
jgi:tetratricopeptide (TPR) repeat protein